MKGDVRILPMPKLSPTMNEGKITKWYYKIGEEVNSYDHIVDISTFTLTQDCNTTTNNNHNNKLPSDLEIEILENMYVAKILANVNDTLPAGSPIAILCDYKEDIEIAAKIDISNMKDVYLETSNSNSKVTFQNRSVSMALWQGYVQTKNYDSSCECS
jgi:pyruvate/2-oxoglutarate dehydrogenase complex dihydrolipoamide acyltransferase (E2) component